MHRHPFLVSWVRSSSRAAAIAIACTTALGCSAPAHEGDAATDDEALRTAPFVDAEETLVGDDDVSRWVAMKAALAQSFAAACPPGRCAGRFARAAPIRFACSAARATGALAECAWILGESTASVDRAMGGITVRTRGAACAVPMATTARALADALTAPDATPAIARRLPGAQRSFLDTLGRCLGASDAPAGAREAAAGRHVDLAAALADDATRREWQAVVAALDEDFDDVCGDTFCEGDDGDIASLGIACAVERSSGAVDGCTWTFAAAATRIAPRSGDVQAKTKFFRCPIAVHATAADLVSALAAPGPTARIHRPLPGGAPALYDQLVGCL